MILGDRMKDISKKSNTLYLLDKYNLKATKKYGQNFIIDSNIIRKIVDTTGIDKETCVIEIGPGIGALTEYLSYNAGFVICYEIDERLREVLNESLSECRNVEVVFQDILSVDLDQVIHNIKKEYSKVSVVTNIPYYITSDIVEKIIRLNERIDNFTAMVQKEVAVKLSNEASPLSLMIQYAGEYKYCFSVSKNVFIPKPRVDSAIIQLTFLSSTNEKLYDIINKSFRQKRKTIYNNLKDVFDDPLDILNKCSIDAQARAEQLSLDDYIALSKYL